MSDNVDATASLGDSKVSRIEHSPCHAIPEAGKLPDDEGHVCPSVGREKSGHILDDKPFGSTLFHQGCEIKPETASRSSETCPLAGDGDVLAREAARPDIGVRDVGRNERSEVFMSLHSWPVRFQHAEAERLNLALEDGLNARLLEAEVKIRLYQLRN